MTGQKIESQDIAISQVFQDFYTVPDYQREYVWQSEQVEQLLKDIHAEFSGGGNPKPEYFIGSIVVCPGEKGVFDLIDGQQRMTTLFLVLCAIRDHLRAAEEKIPGTLEAYIANTSTDEDGKDHFRYRLVLQYEDSGNVLLDIAKGTHDADAAANTRSIANIKNAYDVARGFLEQEFDNNPEGVKIFYGYLTNTVKLIRIKTEDVAKALKIFETINDRGIGLDSMDLLKNLLFMKANAEDFEKLKTLWKEVQDTINEMRDKPLRFLRYFVFSHYDTKKVVLREDDVYGWLSKNESVCGYGSDPLKFAKVVLRTAQDYKRFLDGNNQRGERNPYLQNITHLGGKTARQHLILLLAGRHLSDELFDQLAHEVEELFFAYVLARESTRDFEQNFVNWAEELRSISEKKDFARFIEEHFVAAKKRLSDRFDFTFAALDENLKPKYRLRYILAKLTQHIDMQAYGENEDTKWLSRYIDSSFEIEHIHPQNPDDDAVVEFGKYEDIKIVKKLGNLTLVERSLNASLGNKPYSKKKEVYPKSKLLFTTALPARPKFGKSTQMDKTVAKIEPFPTWNEEAVNARQKQLAALARKVWNMP